MFKENSFLPTEESFRLRGDNDAVFDQMLADNFDEFNPTAQELLEHRLRKYQRQVVTQEQKIRQLEEVLLQRYETVGRHGLNYAKLYHNHDDGYSMEKLKKLLKRMKEDTEDGLQRHPLLDPKESKKLDQKLKKVLGLGETKAAQKGDEENEEAEPQDDDVAEGEKEQELKEWQDLLQRTIEEHQGKDEVKLFLALSKLLTEKRAKERE